MTDDTPRLYLIVRRDVVMTPAKLAVQCMHASEGALAEARAAGTPDMKAYEGDPLKRKIVLRVDGAEKLANLERRAAEHGLTRRLQVDAGLTELAPDTPTALAVGPCRPSALPNAMQRLRLL